MDWGDHPDISVLGTGVVLSSPVVIPNKTQDAYKGCFLGISQSIGDAFCFLVLTVTDDDSSPQVLAR
jgi:hypothetical protein